ncbi:trigger factor [Adlercreutzia sp. ZJ304]|uniref:trigger factor n=1 Tax=Adlercreutzia sp. ZJ304 TaxID=2709791 RepID=UPI0013EB79B3|nr:trigger factor [Adlercreutzia sp. ZJ304]
MQITVNSQKDNKVSVSATVEAKTVDSYIAKTYKDFARRYNFPGFRKGKAPRPVVDNALGREAVMATATENLINDTYPQIIEEEKLYPAGQPDFGKSDEMIVQGSDFTFDFTLPVRPEIELTSYDALEIELPQSGASEAEIEEQMKQLLAHYQQEEATEQWAKETMGFESLNDMKKQVAQSIEDQKEAMLPRLKENACVLKLIERVDADVPEGMAEQKESQLLQDFFTQLQRSGASFDSYLMQQGIDSDQFKEDVKRQAEDEVKRDMALDAWARHAGIEATDEDVSHEFEVAAGEGAKDLEKEWRDSGRLYLIREELVRSKAMENIMDGAKVVEVDFAKRAQEAEAAKKESEKSDESANAEAQTTDEESAE